MMILNIAGAVADATSQGVAIAFDNQHGFSTKEMFENAIAAGATAGLGAALGAGNLAASKDILANAAAFAEYAAIGLTVQLFEMEVGLRKSIDIKFIIEQALGQTAAGKINAELPKDSSAHATHFVDDAANMGISELFGYTPNLSTLSNMLGDQVVDGSADVIGSIKTQHSAANINTPVGASTDPTQFTRSALQTESQYINNSMAADNEEFDAPTAPFYTAYTTTQTSGINAITSASMFAQYQAANDGAVQRKANAVQEHATRVAQAPSLTDKIANGLDTFTRDLMGDVAGRYGTDYFDSLRDGSDLNQRLTNAAKFLGADIGLQLAGEVGVGALGYAADFAGPAINSIAKNTASFFGSRNVADSVDIDLGAGPIIAKHPLDGWTPEQIVQHVNDLGLKTQRDQLILWSGLGRSNVGVTLSQQYALENGGITLELTPGGSWLNKMDLFGVNSPFSRAESGKIWENVSTQMIQKASGQVRSLIGQVSPTSAYRAEQSEAMMNKNILGLDELNLKPRYIFGK